MKPGNDVLVVVRLNPGDQIRHVDVEAPGHSYHAEIKAVIPDRREELERYLACLLHGTHEFTRAEISHIHDLLGLAPEPKPEPAPIAEPKWEPRVGDKVIFTYKSPGMDIILKEEVQPPSIGIILHLFEIRGEKLALVDWYEGNPRPHPLPPITCRPVSMLKLANEQTP